TNTPEDWSRDGRFLSVQTTAAQGRRTQQVFVLDVASGKRVMSIASPGNSQQGDSAFSPDGRFLAYDSDESGRYEVYVQAFPGPSGKWQISSGGALPHWRGDGKEIYYLSLDFKIMAAAVETAPAFHVGTPAPLFAIRPGTGSAYDVAPDGNRFLVDSLG